MKIGFISCPKSLSDMPERWSYDLALELAVEEEKGNMIGLTDNAMIRVSVEALIDQAKKSPVNKIIIWGGLQEYQFAKQYVEELKPYAEEVVVRGFPQGLVNLPIENAAVEEYTPDELPYPSWYHFPLPDYWKNSPLVYTGETVTLTKRCPFKSSWTRGAQSPKRVLETMRFLRLAYGYDWLDWDEDLTSDPSRSQEIFRLLDEYDLAGLFQWSCRIDPERLSRSMVEALRMAGCRVVDFGELDPLQTRDLALMSRIETAINVCRIRGIYPTLQCVIGEPDTKREDLIETLKFLKKMDLLHRPKIMEPYPGAGLCGKASVLQMKNIDEQLLTLNRGFWNLTGWSDIELLGIVELMAKGDLERLERIRPA